jgi:hypothetical protein
MLLILLSAAILIPVLMGWGKIVNYIFTLSLKGISGNALSGIFGISILWTILAFFVPLNLYVEISTIFIGLIFFLKDHIYKEFYFISKKDYILLVSISVIIVFCGSFYPYILDHFGYYVPTIKWLTEFGLLK